MDAIKNSDNESSNEISAVNAACNLRRRAVWRYTKIDASSVVSTGKRQIADASSPGLAIVCSDEKINRTSSIASPAPRMAATSDAMITSFRRILFQIPRLAHVRQPCWIGR